MSSAAVLFVSAPAELVLVRALIGVAAAMDRPRFDGVNVSTLRGRCTPRASHRPDLYHRTRWLAVGPTIGGLVLAIALWQTLLLINVPIAALAFLGIRLGIRADRPDELHLVPIDVLGAVLGTAAIVLALLTPTMLLDAIPGALAVGVATVVTLAAFVVSQHRASHPLIDMALSGAAPSQQIDLSSGARTRDRRPRLHRHPALQTRMGMATRTRRTRRASEVIT